MWLSIVLVASFAADRRTPVVEAVQAATPSVVALEVEIPTQSPFTFFGGGGVQLASSQGSGVVIDPRGVVLTNAHVVQGATRIRAHTLDKRSFEATPIALDTELDLAVLQLEDASGLQAITVADSDALLLGETVIAIGNPYGLGLTVSTGVVASIDRQVEIHPGVYQNYVQTDAAINPGNSGGALIDIEGRLIGINTAIRAEAEGIGFAIPANRARKIADDLLLYGSVRAPWLGCDFSDISARKLAGTGLDRGALRVAAVHAGGPCAKAGIERGDLVFQIDGRPTASRADLNAWLASKKPGDRVVLEAVHRDAVVARELNTTDLPDDAGKTALARLGVKFTPLDRSLAVMEATAEGTFAQAGLRAGDVIVAVDGVRVTDEGTLLAALSRAKARHQPGSLFTIRRGRVQGHVPVGV
jgi:serine protease Do